MYRPRRPKQPPWQNLDEWLLGHPAVAASIVWEDFSGPHAYPSWSAEWKAELRHAYLLARTGESIPVAEVPPNQWILGDDDAINTAIAPADAWAYYRASVARSLAAEIDREVHWSVTSYTAEELAQLFDSRAMFRFIRLGTANVHCYQILSYHGTGIPAPPIYSYRFLTGNSLIGDTRISTIARVLGWCRNNLVHYTCYHFNPVTYQPQLVLATEDTWQYRGSPPMVRVLAGTVVRSRPERGVRCYTMGCHGTVGLLRALLRVVNIPVKYVESAHHAQPYFMTEGRYLCHGDHANAGPLTQATPPIPAEEFLIDQATYDAWFGPGVSETDRSHNISRRWWEVVLRYLPNDLLRAHCHDIANGRGHGDGDVFWCCHWRFTPGELEDMNLWSRIEAKIAELGGCDHIPATRDSCWPRP